MFSTGKARQHPKTSVGNLPTAGHSLSTTTTRPSSDASRSSDAGHHSTGSDYPRNKIPPQDIIDTLNLLEETESEVSCEVSRIQDEIKEVRVMVEEYRRERRARVKENAVLVAEEERLTTKADDDLWLAA